VIAQGLFSNSCEDAPMFVTGFCSGSIEVCFLWFLLVPLP